MSCSWKDLQNGSDIRGIALPGVTNEPVNLSPEVAYRLGKSLAVWYARHFPQEDKKITVSVGTDSRLSGPILKQSFCKGLTDMGNNILDFGLATTPSMFMSVVDENTRCHAAVMITASHLPFNRNGFKFFSSQGGFEKADITELLSIAETEDFPAEQQQGSMRHMHYIEEYAAFLVSLIRSKVNHPEYFNMPLKGLKIIVDAGNGAGGFFASHVLQVLGADTTGSQYLDPDGNFPHHAPNPEDEEAMKAIEQKVLTTKADLGIIFDTDVDRAAIVDRNGKGINRNRLIALLSAIILEEHPGSSIVTDSVTSEGLTRFIEKLSGHHHRFKRGYRNVINEALRLNTEGKPCWLAIETSGHAAMKENYFLDDGAYVIARILIKLARLHHKGNTIEKLIENLAEPVESREFRIKINDEDFQSYGKKVIDGLQSLLDKTNGWEKAKINYEGIRIACNPSSGNGWFLLRLSLHDPVLPLNVESDDNEGVPFIVKRLVKYLSDFDKLDINSLKKYIINQ
jgi:phosphomannomutase